MGKSGRQLIAALALASDGAILYNILLVSWKPDVAPAYHHHQHHHSRRHQLWSELIS